MNGDQNLRQQEHDAAATGDPAVLARLRHERCRPLCSRSIRWAARQLSSELTALGLNYASSDSRAVLAKAVNARLAREWNRIEGEARDLGRQCYYFGTWEGPGHYWVSASPQHKDRQAMDSPFGPYPDGNYQPANKREEEQVGVIRHKGGWTILAWWDRSVDKRGGCCGALVYSAELGFADMVGLLAGRFPLIHARVTPMKQWHGKTRMEVR